MARHYMPRLADTLHAVRRLVRRAAIGSFMSDTKWRKLVTAVNEAGFVPLDCVVKFIDVAEPKTIRFPTVWALHPPRPWVDTEFGPVEFNSIEWLEILSVVRVTPANGLSPTRRAVDLASLRAVIEALGRYPIEEMPDRLRILGHTMRPGN